MKAQVHFTDIKAHILQHIHSADSSLKLAVSWLTDKEIFALLMEKLQAGVRVALVTRNDYLNNHPDALPWDKFIATGGKLFFSRDGEQLHYKYILADDRAALCTSYNLTCFANGNNRENVMIMEDEAFVKRFVDEFAYLLSTLKEEEAPERQALTDVAPAMLGFYETTLANDKARQVV